MTERVPPSAAGEEDGFGVKGKQLLSFLENGAMIRKKNIGRKTAMEYLIGAVIGLLWGALIAWLNSRINKKAIAKNDTKAIMTANMIRMAIDVAALAAVFLLRKVLPWNFEATIAGTAASLGLLTVYFAFRLSKPERKE